MARHLGLADQFEEPPLALDQWQVAQVVTVMLDQVPKAYSTVSWPRRRLRSASKSGVPSSREITASPSIRNEVALMRSVASTIAGGRPSQDRCG
jgi:hypothetical protein